MSTSEERPAEHRSAEDAPAAELPAKLADCLDVGPGSGAELFIVEGDSAAGAVDLMRDRRTQAVLPVQGKLLNTAAVSRNRMLAHDQCRSIVAALGIGCGDDVDLARRRYDRVVLLCDADADGIHSRSLLLIFFAGWLRPFLDEGRLLAARPPLFSIRVLRSGERYHAWQPEQRDTIMAKLTDLGVGRRSSGSAVSPRWIPTSSRPPRSTRTPGIRRSCRRSTPRRRARRPPV